jgi:hypothetical protein
MTLDGLLAFLRLEVDRAGGINALGRKWGLCSGHISRILRKEKIPGPVVLARLGLRERVEYEPDVRRQAKARKEGEQ